MAEMWKFIALQIAFPLAIIVVSYLVFNLRRRANGNGGAGVIPGSTGLPLVGESFSFFQSFRNPRGVQSFTESRFKRYGRTFITNIVGRNWVFTSYREAAKLMFSSEHRLFRFGSNKTAKYLLGGNSIFYAGEDIHRKIRKLVGEPLLSDNLKKIFEKIEAICLETLDEWSGKTVSVIDGTSMFTFRTISHIIASMENGPELSKLHMSFIDILDGTTGFNIKLPGTSYYRGCKARENLIALLDNIIQRRRKGEEIKDDFIQSMISRDGFPQEERLTDLEIKDNCLALLLAGHSTTGAALMWAMKFLEENPDSKKILMEEYEKILNNKAGSSITNLAWDDIQKMPYASKVILETLRMANPTQWSVRTVLHDFSLQGFTIKKGWNLAIDHCSLHYDFQNFKDPTKFNPSRFDEPLNAYSFIGFGGGSRTCLGVNLAKLEMVIFLYHLCTKYRWTSVGKENALSPSFIRVLKDGYQVKVECK